MLTLRRFLVLAVSYGTDLSRWPPEVRPAAKRLLEQSAQARAALASEEELDSAIALTARREAMRLERDQGSEAALAQLRLGVAARIRHAPRRARHEPEPAPLLQWFGAHLAAFWRVGFATAACAAMIAGFLIGTHYDGASRPGDLLATLSFNPIQNLVD